MLKLLKATSKFEMTSTRVTKNFIAYSRPHFDTSLTMLSGHLCRYSRKKLFMANVKSFFGADPNPTNRKPNPPQSDSDWGRFLFTFELGLLVALCLVMKPGPFLLHVWARGAR